MAEDFLVNFSASEVNALLSKIQESSVFTAEEKQKLSSAINSSGVAYKALADGVGNNIQDTYQTKLTSAQLSAVNSGIDDVKVSEIVELIDSGGKNHVKIDNFTATLWQNIEVEPIGGTVHFHIGEYTSTDTDADTFLVTFRYTNGTTASRNLTKGPVDAEYNLGNSVLNRIDIYASDNWNHSSNDTVTVSELMICSKTAWDISQKYVSASPSNAELYAMIQNLQNNNSAQSNQSVSWLNSEME